MLLGRADEVGRIDGLLRAAGDGISAALIIHGEAGIGKTSLLEHIARRSETTFVVLSARPLESETELPFAGLADLVRPIEHLLDRLPERQRTALTGALALGPPAPTDRFGVAAATLTLLATAAGDAPVLAVIDDAQWLDTPSREALLFACRRLAGEGVVLLFATRDHAWIRDVGISTLELHGLAPDDTEALLLSTGVTIDARVRRELAAATRGNPLALLEAIRALPDAELTGTAPLASPPAVGAVLERAFALHLDGLPVDTRQALLIAAASKTGATDEIMRALAASGCDRTALEPAERLGLITVAARVEFRHPLIRSAAYHGQDIVERRAAHRALATALGDGEKSVWHLADATLGPDERIAAELESVGQTALARSAYAAAGNAFETAADLTPDDAERLRRTLVAGRALWLGGESRRAAALLESVVELATDPAVRADLQQLRCAATMFTRPVSETYATLIAEAERVQPHDPARAAAMFATAGLAGILLGDVERGGDCARRADAVAERESDMATLVVPAMLAVVAASLGELVGGHGRLADLLERTQAEPPLGERSTITAVLAWTSSWVEEWTLAQGVIEQMIGAARAAGAPSVLPLPLAMLSELEFRRGRLAAAYAAATESVQLAADTGQTIASAYSLAMLARAEAVLGHETASRVHVAAALTLTAQTGARAFDSYCALTLGVLELSHGRPERVAEQRAGSARIDEPESMVLTSAIQAAADRVEAYARSGAPDEASRALAFLELQAERFGLRWPRAAAARCRGLLAREDFEAEFATALELFGDDMPFERARTNLCLGMRRRRAHRRAGARTALHEALAYFEAAGAEPWAEQTRAELRASGETAAHEANGSLRSLTPQELQVALIVAKGATNRQVGASLFLSEKTVEFHLSNTYRKLGLRSRGELIRRVEGLP